MNTNENKPNFYTVNQVHEIVFQGTLSKTTIHQMIRRGKNSHSGIYDQKINSGILGREMPCKGAR